MGGDCIGLGIESLGNSEECKKAAASLGKRFEEIENNFAWQKNCYFFAVGGDTMKCGGVLINKVVQYQI